MKTVIVVLSVLGLCLSAPVDQDAETDNEPVIGEGQQMINPPLDQTDAITRNILFPVPRAENIALNPYFNYQSAYYPQSPYHSLYYPQSTYYPQYPYYQHNPSYPYYPAYTLPPVIISVPQRNV